MGLGFGIEFKASRGCGFGGLEPRSRAFAGFGYCSRV